MSVISVDRQLALALEAFHREHIDESTLVDVIRVCLSSGQSLDEHLVQAGLVTETNVESIVDFLAEQELGDEAWEHVPDKLFGTLKESLERVESGADPPAARSTDFTSNAFQDPGRFAIIESHAHGGLGEVFAVGELGVGVGFEEIGLTIGREAEVHACVARELERTVGALGELGEFFGEPVGQVFGQTGVELDFLLVVVVPLDAGGGDAWRAFAEGAKVHLPDGEGVEALVADDADVELAAVDVLLGQGVGADGAVDVGDALGQLLIAGDDRRLADADADRHLQHRHCRGAARRQDRRRGSGHAQAFHHPHPIRSAQQGGICRPPAGASRKCDSHCSLQRLARRAHRRTSV